MLMKPKHIVDAVRNGDVALLSTMAAIALATNPLFATLRNAQESSLKFLAREE